MNFDEFALWFLFRKYDNMTRGEIRNRSYECGLTEEEIENTLQESLSKGFLKFREDLPSLIIRTEEWYKRQEEEKEALKMIDDFMVFNLWWTSLLHLKEELSEEEKRRKVREVLEHVYKTKECPPEVFEYSEKLFKNRENISFD